MRILNYFILSSLVSAAAFAQDLQLVSAQAGRVDRHLVTTREVLINSLVENVIGRAKPVTGLKLSRPQTREFIREATAVLLEWAIFYEIESSATANVTVAEIKAAKNRVLAKYKKNAQWAALKVESSELDDLVERKLRAKKFIQFKIQTSTVPVSDREAQEYFEANKIKFENAPFESFKETIKSYLSRQQVDRRLKDWFELLQVKYKVRNFLAE